MENKDLVKKIDEFLNMCDEADTWYDKDLVEDALSLLEKCRDFLNSK